MQNEDQILICFDKFLRERSSATRSLEYLFGGKTATVKRYPADVPILEQNILALFATSLDKISYRNVSIEIDNCVLSRAQNWYCRDALTDAMNTSLERSNIPFGKIIEPLQFKRVWLSSEFFWQAWGRSNTKTEPILRHRALLYLPNGLAFCFLEENYLSSLKAVIRKNLPNILG